MSGWYNSIRQATQPPDVARAYQGLADTVQFLAKWRILPYPEIAIARYEKLAKLKLNVRKMDLRIAATALEGGAILVTRNLREFGRVRGLKVVDWHD